MRRFYREQCLRASLVGGMRFRASDFCQRRSNRKFGPAEARPSELRIRAQMPKDVENIFRIAADLAGNVVGGFACVIGNFFTRAGASRSRSRSAPHVGERLLDARSHPFEKVVRKTHPADVDREIQIIVTEQILLKARPERRGSHPLYLTERRAGVEQDCSRAAENRGRAGSNRRRRNGYYYLQSERFFAFARDPDR
jgi:hypothetical protein